MIAGGAARRFGGDKAAALLGGMPLIEHAAAAIAPRVGRIVIVGRTGAGFHSVDDLPEPGLGPLGGICGALAYAHANGFAHVLTIACDMPRLPEGLAAALIAAAPAWCEDAPVLGCWRADDAPALERHLRAGGDRSVRRWAMLAGMRPVAAGAPLPNVNTPADLLAL